MEKELGYCGYNCALCPARSDDPAVRQKLVDGWRKIFGHEHYTAENVKCDGCCSDGKLADHECQARPCAREKGMESCALCSEFPCKKVGHLLGTRDGMLVFCHRNLKDLTEEEYNLCMRQFDSMPDLVKLLVQTGKLPKWLGEETNEQ
jgi:hypothetical protein